MKILGKDLLRTLKEADILGEDAHKVYSPPYRPVLTEQEILSKDPKLAAVNILMYYKNGGWYFPLMVRSQNEHDRHSGQISLPGGKREESDTDFAATALRETEEEMGISRNRMRIVRQLSSIYIPPSNFYVHPFISFTVKNPEFRLQEAEAVELIEFPVESILNLKEQPEMMVLPGSRDVEVPVIHFEGYKIWGATSMILSELSHLLRNL